MFKRFYSERPVQQFGNHSGLGLAISKQIVEAHQGVIWAENIRLPDAEPDSPPAWRTLCRGLAALTMGQATVHASTVAFDLPDGPQALVLSGRSGSGKSALALDLLALGARLVSDDQTVFHVEGDRLIASAPPAIAGLIEWRGVGLLPVAHLAQAPVVLWVDMDNSAQNRLPAPQWHEMLGLRVARLHIPAKGATASGLRQYMLGQAWITGCENMR